MGYNIQLNFSNYFVVIFICLSIYKLLNSFNNTPPCPSIIIIIVKFLFVLLVNNKCILIPITFKFQIDLQPVIT